MEKLVSDANNKNIVGFKQQVKEILDAKLKDFIIQTQKNLGKSFSNSK